VRLVDLTELGRLAEPCSLVSAEPSPARAYAIDPATTASAAPATTHRNLRDLLRVVRLRSFRTATRSPPYRRRIRQPFRRHRGRAGQMSRSDQFPPLRMGTRVPSLRTPTTSTSDAPIMRST